MKCLTCGSELKSDAKFCVKCGTAVLEEGKSEVKIEKETSKTDKFDFCTVIMGCLMFILNVILKPVSTLKEKIENYSNIKTAGILVVLISFGRMVINLLGSMISVIFTKKITNYWNGDTKLSISFENLKELDYLSLIFKEFFMFVVVIAALAGVYYIVAMIMKKSANYFKLVTITAVSFIPSIVVGSFVSVIIAYIYAPLASFLVCAAFIYSFLTFVNAMDDELNIDDSNLKVYFHTICLTVIIIVVYYVTANKIDSSLTSLLK